jgi:hypothetical protein
MANVDGTWKTVIENSPLGNVVAVLTVDSSGDSFTGTCSSSLGTIEVEDGKVDGGSLTWNMHVTVPFPTTLDCKATVSGDQMSGTVKVPSFGSYPLTGTRE